MWAKGRPVTQGNRVSLAAVFHFGLPFPPWSQRALHPAVRNCSVLAANAEGAWQATLASTPLGHGLSLVK